MGFISKSSPTEELSPSVFSFEECLEAGYLILESYPEQCMTPDGRTFTREIDEEDIQTEELLLEEEMVIDDSTKEDYSKNEEKEGVFRSEKYGFEFEYPLDMEVIDRTGSVEAAGTFLSLALISNNHDLIFNLGSTKGFFFNLFDLSQKNRWMNYNAGFVYNESDDTWFVDGTVCPFPSDSNYPSQEKFIVENKKMESDKVLNLLRECANFHSSALITDGVYHFSRSNLEGFGDRFVIIDRKRSYVAEFGYDYLFDRSASENRESERIEAIRELTGVIYMIVSSFSFSS